MQLGFFFKRPLRVCPKSIAPFALAAAFILSVSHAQAAQIVQIKGAGVKIGDADTEHLTEGGKYFVVVGGKKVAVVQITRVAGKQALGKIIKGDPSKVAVGAAVTSGKAAPHTASHKKSVVPADLTVGALVGYSMDSQTVKETAGTMSMTGSGISLKAFGDIPISSGLGVIVRAGFEQFGVTGTVSGLSGSTKITYLTGDLLMRYHFIDGTFAPFVAGGVGIYFPMSKSSSNALDESKISATSLLLLNAGLNYNLSDTLYLMGLLEYALFPPSSAVTTSAISIRLGAGMRF